MAGRTGQRVERSANMVVIADENQIVTWVNKSFSKVTGWSLAEMRGRKAGQLLRGPLTDAKAIQAIGDRLMVGASVTGVELVNYRKSGEPYTVLVNIEPIKDRAGHTVAYFSIQSEVTAQRSLEQANARLKIQLEQAQRLAGIGQLRFDEKTCLVAWSPEVNAILELAPSVSGAKFSELRRFVASHAVLEVTRDIESAVASRSEFDREIPIVTAKGHKRWVRCLAAPEQLPNGETAALTWVVQDVTVYKQLIQTQQEKNDALTSAVTARTQDLETAYRSLEAFSHALSHDLKKPVRHVVSYAEIVKEMVASGDADAALSYSDKLIAAGVRMRSLIDGMLALSRFGRQGVKLSRVDMRPHLAECLAETAATFPDRRYTASGHENFPVVVADAVLLYQVWRNLLDNAFKYSSPAKTLDLRFACEVSYDGWTLHVQDNGSGFDGSQSTRIFEMFSRAHSGPLIAGDGIGLGLCRKIIDAHGGRIWAESQCGSGSRFSVFLPRVASKSAHVPIDTAPGPKETDMALAFHGWDGRYRPAPFTGQMPA
ncbi:MAG: ATP-binding protein [Burkholderiaceae bacterium]